MKFKRLLTAGLMALFCAGTATAASQLNSVQVTPTASTATVNLRTTGSFAHKEYRLDDHVLMVDLTGVTADAAVEREAAPNSAVLKSYKISRYTSASGSEVTRIAFTLGDQVTADVNDVSDGLQVLLTGGAPGTAKSLASAATVGPPAPPTVKSVADVPKPAPAETSISSRQYVPVFRDLRGPQAEPVQAANDVAPQPVPVQTAKEVVPQPEPAQATKEVVPVVESASAALQPLAQPAMVAAPRPAAFTAAQPSEAISSLTPVAIRRVSVRRGQGTMDIVIEGPSSAHPFLLKNPDRLVLDFSNVVMRPSVRNIAVHTRDVLEVRVGRFSAKPLVTRIVIDLGGPRTFDVLPSANQVVVRVKTEDGEMLSPPRKAAPAPVLASAVPPPSAVEPSSRALNLQNDSGANAALASASRVKDAAMPAPANSLPLPSQPVHDPEVRAEIAAETMANSSPREAKPAVEMAKLSPPPQGQLPASVAPTVPAASTPKYTGEPISVNFKDVDLKDFFRLIHEISGLNIVLDPNVRGTVTLVLDDVPWDQALDIVLKNNGLDRELQGNVLRIAATDTLRREAVDRRAQSEAIALAVDRQTISRFLSYAKAKDVVPTIKKFLTARGDVISDDRTNALIISDIPSVIPNLDRLISQLDKKSQEVEIEVRVVSATRSFTRDLGFQLGFNWGNGVSTIGGSNPNGATAVNTGTTTNNVNNVPLFTNLPATGATTGFSLSNITASYGIEAVLTAAETHGLAKVLSRPRVVTQSNVKAEVKQGVKIPVYTAGTANANSSVSYVDAVLRLSVTPQVTADNTIFLTVDVENTQPGTYINSNFELTTQQATTQVLVTDGGTVVIGGVIQTTNSVSTSQTPVLGNIPWLGNLFKSRHVSTETDELIFFITPKIIQT
jgi:type IV pilus assembly protein PilQ